MTSDVNGNFQPVPLVADTRAVNASTCSGSRAVTGPARSKEVMSPRYTSDRMEAVTRWEDAGL